MGKKNEMIETGATYPKAGKRFAVVLAAVFLLLAAILATLLYIYISDGSLALTPLRYSQTERTELPQESTAPVSQYQQTPIIISGENPLPDVIESVSPSVVGIVTYVDGQSPIRDELVIYGSGSGFIVSADGYVLTNHHVIDGAEQIRVLFEDGEEVVAELIGSDVTTDIAVLRIEKENLTPVALGDSDGLRVGDFVLAIGNPLDSVELYGTVTFGIVSATARSVNIDGFTNEYIQTDAAVNFGNSGGPLLNLNGEVVGMNTAKTVTAGYDEYGNAISAEGIGFALPINDVRDIMEQLIEMGSIPRPGIGVTVITLTEADAEELGLVPGIMIYTVTEGGPAAEAGLQAGDVVIACNGETLTAQEELVDYIQQTGIGNVLTLTVSRGGEELEISITVGDMNKMNTQN
ncbi:MAG: trypsin-like peptidase domain-containing protein [Clostridia bacterium]|nr:trypsin-like peptidase domain-containing protein [Clostridia bacterium]